MPPIIVNEKGDVSLYQTITEGEVALEAIDVKNEEYTIFDSQGLLIVPIVEADGIHVRLVESSPPDRRPDQLENILRRFLSQLDTSLTGYDEDSIWGMRLAELVQTMKRVWQAPKPRWWKFW